MLKRIVNFGNKIYFEYLKNQFNQFATYDQFSKKLISSINLISSKLTNLLFMKYIVVVVVLIFCSWVKSSRATLFVLSASTCHQQVL